MSLISDKLRTIHQPIIVFFSAVIFNLKLKLHIYSSVFSPCVILSLASPSHYSLPCFLPDHHHLFSTHRIAPCLRFDQTYSILIFSNQFIKPTYSTNLFHQKLSIICIPRQFTFLFRFYAFKVFFINFSALAMIVVEFTRIFHGIPWYSIDFPQKTTRGISLRDTSSKKNTQRSVTPIIYSISLTIRN